MSIVSIDDRNAANFPVKDGEVTFKIDTAANTYEAFDKEGKSLGSSSFTPPEISAFGFTFAVDSKAPATDSFTFDLSIASGDNSNVQAMTEISDKKLMENGKATINDIFEQTKQDVASDAKAAQIREESATALYKQASDRVAGVSGVNLDEEAGNLIRFQQAYQASARIMTTASELFDTLLSAGR